VSQDVVATSDEHSVIGGRLYAGAEPFCENLKLVRRL
jgi:hypothetical protein